MCLNAQAVNLKFLSPSGRETERDETKLRLCDERQYSYCTEMHRELTAVNVANQCPLVLLIKVDYRRFVPLHTVKV